MEALLMDGGDSSSGSEDEAVITSSTNAAAAAAAAVSRPTTTAPTRAAAPTPAPAAVAPPVALPKTTPAPAPAAAAAAAPPPKMAAPAANSPAAAQSGMSQADQMARLKSLYSAQPKRAQPSQAPPPKAAPAPAPTNMSRPVVAMAAPAPAPAQASQPVRQAPPQHQQQQQQQPPPQQQLYRAPSLTRPNVLPAQPSQSIPRGPSNAVHRPQSTSRPPQAASQVMQPPASSNRPTSSTTEDPYAPTPLNQIKERQAEKQRRSSGGAGMPHQPPVRQHSQTLSQSHPQTHSRTTSPHPSSTVVPASTAVRTQPSSSSSSRSAPRTGHPQPSADRTREAQLRKQKERFLMFTRVLMRYLEQKDPPLHQKAKLIIKDCAERNKRQEVGFESVTASMRERLKKLVGDQYWARAESYLKHYMERRSEQQSSSTAAAGSSSAAASSSSRTAATTAATSQTQTTADRAQLQKQRLEQERARSNAAAKAAKQKQLAASSAAAKTTAAPIVPTAKTDIEKRQALAASSKTTAAAAAGTTTAATAAAAAASAGKTAKKTVTKRKAATSPPPRRTPAGAPVAVTAAPAEVPRVAPPREYKEFMETIDHAIDYDWTVAGELLGSAIDISLSEEQHNLLYKTSAKAKTQAKSAEVTPKDSHFRRGWGNKNVCSVRSAFARVRLAEKRRLKQEAEKKQKPSAAFPPAVAGGILKLAPPEGVTAAGVDPSKHAAAANNGSSSAQDNATELVTWVNEEKAEQDDALAVLSEGCQLFLKGILEKAVFCARQRQNLDGIRLWHEQHLPNTSKNAATTVEQKSANAPPLSLRLGCDVARQVAQAAGNAALTCRRMEEALDRQSGIPSRNRILKGDTLLEASSMSELAMRPKLARGMDNADDQAKRSFEVYGGRDAMEPFGRIPKQAKLELIDFTLASNFATTTGVHQATTTSASLFF